MKEKFFKKAAIGIGFGLTLLPLLTLAAVGSVPTTPFIKNLADISDLIGYILTWISGIVLVIAIIMLLYSALLYLTAGGSEDRVGKAKNYLIYAIVGIVVAVLAYSVQPFIEGVLGRQR